MNAPLAPSAVQTSALPVDKIRPSNTHIQQLRRERFDPKLLQELADSMRALGQLQPIVVRPWGEGLFEVVAGERRWLAARLAGFPTIEARVSELTDDQVLEVQLVENLQREGLHALEEAEGYDQLMKLKKISADEVAEKVGKSRAYVYAKLKLLALGLDGRKAFYAGQIDESRALLVARISNPKLQEKALKLALETGWKGDPLCSVRGLREKLTGNGFSVPLDKTPFDRADKTFVQIVSVKKGTKEERPLPDCLSCPNRTGNCLDLFTQGDDPNVCMEPTCYESKLKQFGERTVMQAQEAGVNIIDGDAAKEISPRAGTLIGYVDLDEECEDDEFPEDLPDELDDEEANDKAQAEYEKRYEAHKPRTFRELLQGQKIEPVVMLDPRTKAVRTLVPFKQAEKALKKEHKIELEGWRYGQHEVQVRANAITKEDEAERRKKEEQQRARQEAEHNFRAELLRQIHAKGTAPLKRDDLYLIAESMLEDYETEEAVQIVLGTEPKIGSMKESQLLQLIHVLMVAHCLHIYASPKSLVDVAKRLKIDPDKIKKDLKAAAKAKDTPEKPGKKAPASKKPAGKKAKKS